MPLTDAQIRNARPSDKDRKLYDGRNLYVIIKARTGSRLWRFDYRLEGKRRTLSMGKYPDVGIKLARERREEARQLVAQGRDPSDERRAGKTSADANDRGTFERIAREWFEAQKPRWKPSHSSRILLRLDNDVFPFLGPRPISEISPPEILEVLQRVIERGTIDTAHRIKQNIGQVFRYAVAHGLAERDIAADLRDALPSAPERHYPTITNPEAIGGLLRAIEGFQGQVVTRQALRLLPLVFVRPGELRGAEWNEFDLDKATWKIPAERMKRGRPHLVPLADQSVQLLRELHPRTGDGRLVFPGLRSPDRPISDNTLTGALRRLGYSKDEMVAHGFRAMASTTLNESGLWSIDAIEFQLAHTQGNSIRAAYNYAQRMDERREMMQWWADWLADVRDRTPVGLMLGSTTFPPLKPE